MDSQLRFEEKIMNGWIQPSARPQASHLSFCRPSRGYGVELLLEVVARPSDEMSFKWELKASTDFGLCEYEGPVRIEIKEGTKRETALDLINAAAENLERDWDRLITETPNFIGRLNCARRMIDFYDRQDDFVAIPPDEDVSF
jgi:hypothetical protein